MQTGKKVSFKHNQQPLLIVVVDTEEEFDWMAHPDRAKTAVSHMEQLHLTQDICTEYGLSPCYVIDYPIASQELGINVLKEYVDKNQCEIGAHLHPWVNPPFDEDVTVSNMYPGNLAKEIEYNKLKILRDKIEESFGFKPTSYKAGRYGFGSNTLDTISELGFNVDLSYCPPMDHRHDGGPDYSKLDPYPFFFDTKKILEIPISGAFIGKFGGSSRQVFNLAERFKNLRVPGILSRTNLLDRLVLSPEGYTSEEHIKLTKFLYNQGHRVFTWSFHSPTVVPGHTQYVSNDSEKQKYLDSFHRFFDFFFNTLNGRASTPAEIYQLTEK